MNKKAEKYFIKADKYLENNKLKKALKYFLKAEFKEKGYCSLNVGYTYDRLAWRVGNKYRKKARLWYKYTIKNNDITGYSNLGCMYREAYKFKKAKKMFKKAIKKGDNEVAYELAKLYLLEGKINKAIKLLKIFKGDRLLLSISEGGQEDALELLKKIEKHIGII